MVLGQIQFISALNFKYVFSFICQKDEALFDLSTVWKSLYGHFSFSHSFAPVPSSFYYFSFKESAEWIITAIFQNRATVKLCLYCSVPLIMCLCIFPVRYAEEWKPINPEDKKRYDREFLLRCQFISASMHKPEGLPIISDVVLDKVGDVELCVKERRNDTNWVEEYGSFFHPSSVNFDLTSWSAAQSLRRFSQSCNSWFL